MEQGPVASSYWQQEAFLWSPEAMSHGMTGSPFQPRWPSNTDKIKDSIASVSSMVVFANGLSIEDQASVSTWGGKHMVFS